MPLNLPATFPRNAMAVLFSGGVESGVLTAMLPDYCSEVYPLYVRFGLAWENAEIAQANHFLENLLEERVKPLTVLNMPVADMYANHWSVTGTNIPSASTPDEAVYLPGRNLLLLSKVATWCSLNSIRAVSLGSLMSNPFPDASNKFFDQMEKAISIGLDEPFYVLRPFATMHKEEVITVGSRYPLHLTFSCINPIYEVGGMPLHCGQCNKCAERQQAFANADMQDKTKYAEYACA